MAASAVGSFLKVTRKESELHSRYCLGIDLSMTSHCHIGLEAGQAGLDAGRVRQRFTPWCSSL
jgi:hypothetical protein